jgi:DNA primase
MGGRIPADAIQRIRERASLVEVVSDVVTLRRRGRTAVGLCPFHTEKTPSFTVSEERGFYHCFGCGEHGDVFGFVMKTQSLAFPEAVRVVAQRFGLPVPEGVEPEKRAGDPLLAANVAAAAFFRRALEGTAGARARAYLAERGVGADVVARFGLGYAPGTGDALARHLQREGVAMEHALTLGLVGRRDAGGFYDRFRDRLMFPIADATSRIVAFGGRILPGRPAAGDPPPKYLNSPESPLFHKGHTLYGLPHARDAIRRNGRAIVVEGYLDVIALAEAGIAEVVAPLGTALTADQLRVLRRLCESVLACFDGDDAGRRAAARSFATFVEAGLWGRGVFLPAGEDPDTFVRRQGRAALEALVAGAEPLVDAFLADLAGPRRDAVGRNVEAAKEVARILRRVRSPLEFEVLVHLAAERLRVGEHLLRGEGTAAAPGAPAPRAPVTDRAPEPEERLVEIMAMDRRLVQRVLDERVIAELEEPTWRRAAEALAAVADDEHRLAVLRTLPREVQDRCMERLVGTRQDLDHEAELLGCIRQIRARAAERERRRLQEAIRAAEARGDEQAAAQAIRLLRGLQGDATEKVRADRSAP